MYTQFMLSLYRLPVMDSEPLPTRLDASGHAAGAVVGLSTVGDPIELKNQATPVEVTALMDEAQHTTSSR